MESSAVKHSVSLAGRRTSVSLENEFWNALKEIAAQREMRGACVEVTGTPAEAAFVRLSS
jgi:predicted DNA-binding ribbon-helix-helix protein